jgi:hypothetical protein
MYVIIWWRAASRNQPGFKNKNEDHKRSAGQLGRTSGIARLNRASAVREIRAMVNPIMARILHFVLLSRHFYHHELDGRACRCLGVFESLCLKLNNHRLTVPESPRKLSLAIGLHEPAAKCVRERQCAPSPRFEKHMSWFDRPVTAIADPNPDEQFLPTVLAVTPAGFAADPNRATILQYLAHGQRGSDECAPRTNHETDRSSVAHDRIMQGCLRCHVALRASTSDIARSAMSRRYSDHTDDCEHDEDNS